MASLALLQQHSMSNALRSIKNEIFRKRKTYNSEDSLVVTHPTTNSPACGLSTAERTGSPVFHTLWSYVLASLLKGTCRQNIGDLSIKYLTVTE
jgi:hypothetical protein